MPHGVCIVVEPGVCQPRRGVGNSDWVIDLDVERFFDSVPHDLVVKAVDALGLPPWVLLYVKRWLAAPAFTPDGQSGRGTGGPRRDPRSAGQDQDRLLQGLQPPRAMGRAGVLRLPGLCLPTLGHHGKERQVHRVRPGSLPEGDQADERDRHRLAPPPTHGPHLGQLAGWIGPVIHGWMTYYGRFRHSELHPLLARINYHVQEWIRAKYRRLRAYKAMKRAWVWITARRRGLLPHWRWKPGPGASQPHGESMRSLVTGDCHTRICGSPLEIPLGHPTI